MRKKINQLAKGIGEEKRPLIQVEPALLEGSVVCGHNQTEELTLLSAGGVSFRGLAYSDDDRIEIPQNAFAGVKTTLSITVRGEDIREDTTLEGRIYLVTNGGELTVPYRFKSGRMAAEGWHMPASLAELSDFAEKSPDTLLKLFESPSFIDLPFLNDDSLRALYQALRKSSDRRLALEEFLVACGAKKAVRLSVEKEPQTYICREERQEGEILVTKSGPGYFIISLESDAPFLQIPKALWTSEDFEEDRIHLPFRILAGRLHEGKNLARITVNTGREEIRIPVTVIPERGQSMGDQKRGMLRRARLQLAGQMVRVYTADERNYSMESQLVRALDSCDMLVEPDTDQSLLRAEIYRQLRRRSEEKEILEQNRAVIQRARTENVNQYLWFLYLEEEMEKGSRLSESFLRLLYRLKEEEADRPELLPLLMRSDSEWADQPEKCFLKIREHFQKGPLPLLLTIEAVCLVKKHPELIRRLDAFSRYLLYFGARYECWDQTVAERAAALILPQKEYHVTHERILKRLYEQYPLRSLLEALLTVVLRRGEPKEMYLPLYEKGIREDVRLADLYEFYLSALPTDYEGDIPQMVQLYYTYNSPSRLKAREALYRYIARQYGPETQMYRLYEKQIRSFALEQLLGGNTSREACFFYEKMFIPEVIDARSAQILAELFHTVRLKLSNRHIERVLVVYGELKQEYAYPVRDGIACVPVFAPFCRLLFVDREGRRYAQNVFKKQRLLRADEGQKDAIRRLSPESLPYKLERCQKAIKEEIDDDEARTLIHESQSWDELSERFREKLVFALVRRSGLNDADHAMLLLDLKNSPYLEAGAGELLAENFLKQGEDEAAVEMVYRFGHRSFDKDLLMRLMNRQIRSRNYAFDKALFGVTLSLYRSGVTSPVTLTYLCRYFNGGTEEMRRLLEAAATGEALYYDLPERLLGQMLFTEETEGLERVMELYLKGTGNPDRQLLHAYAALQCEQYFCREAVIPDNVFSYLESWAGSEKKAEHLPLICQVALTKHYAEQADLNPEEKSLASRLLQNLYDQGIFFTYQQRLGRFIPLPAELADKTLIEYRGSESEPVSLEIRILPQEAEGDFRIMEMPHVFRGIYVRPVLLFADEILEYHILRGGQTIREDRIDGSRQEGSGRFGRLNRVIRSAIRAEEGWQEEILRFGREDVLLKDYFHSL